MKGDFENDGMVEAVKKLVNEGFQRSVWHSLTAMPSGVCFEAQNDDEQVVLFLRRHPVTNLHWIGLILVLFFIPFFWVEFPLLSSISTMARLALTVFWYMGLVFFAFEQLLVWFYNVYIVTNERVIDVDFYGLLYKDVKMAQISRIEDVSYSQRGLFSSFFDYGNVTVETASEQRSDNNDEGSGAFVFEAVSNPDEVVKVISELIEKEDKEREIKR
jgi:uncharacterized membrane protein YdbT with pleckstrin-like domain